MTNVERFLNLLILHSPAPFTTALPHGSNGKYERRRTNHRLSGRALSGGHDALHHAAVVVDELFSSPITIDFHQQKFSPRPRRTIAPHSIKSQVTSFADEGKITVHSARAGFATAMHGLLRIPAHLAMSGRPDVLLLTANATGATCPIVIPFKMPATAPTSHAAADGGDFMPLITDQTTPPAGTAIPIMVLVAAETARRHRQPSHS